MRSTPSNRSPRCWARRYAIDMNAPVSMDQQSQFTPSAHQAKRPYNWLGDCSASALPASGYYIK